MLTGADLHALEEECALAWSRFNLQYHLAATNVDAIQIIVTSSLIASVLQFLQLEECMALLAVNKAFNNVVSGDDSLWRSWTDEYFGNQLVLSLAKSAKVGYYQRFMAEVRRCNGLPDRFKPSPTMNNVTLSKNMRTAVNTSPYRLGSVLCDKVHKSGSHTLEIEFPSNGFNLLGLVPANWIPTSDIFEGYIAFVNAGSSRTWHKGVEMYTFPSESEAGMKFSMTVNFTEGSIDVLREGSRVGELIALSAVCEKASDTGLVFCVTLSPGGQAAISSSSHSQIENSIYSQSLSI